MQNELIYEANLAAEWLMASAPSRIERVAGTILGASESDVTAFAEDLESRFDSLLGRIALFAQAADQVAEVRTNPLLYSLPYSNVFFVCLEGASVCQSSVDYFIGGL